MRASRTCLALLVAVAYCSVALAQSDQPSINDQVLSLIARRPFNNDKRFDEDWSVLAGLDTSTANFFDRIKYVPLNDDASIWASFGGEARFRVESWRNYRFTPDNDDGTTMYRLRLHSDIHVGDNVRVFLEGKSSHITNRGLPTARRNIDVDSIDLHQAFVDVMLPFEDGAQLTLRVGRQELSFGRQHLVSGFDLSNTRRTFEGISAVWESEPWRVTGFWTQLVRGRKYALNHAVNQTRFYGVYAENKRAGLDLYWLGLEQKGAAFNTTTGDERRHTLGGRWFGDIGDTGLGFDLEGAYQTGDIGSADIDAFFITGEVSTNINGAHLFVGAGYASGDNQPGGDVQTFNSLFPHAYRFLGYMAEIGRQNTIDFHSGLIFSPLEDLTVEILGHVFWLADTDDAHYSSANTVLNVGPAPRFVGSELDLRLLYQFNRHWHGLIGYSHFFVGDHPAAFGPTTDGDIFYMNIQFTF